MAVEYGAHLVSPALNSPSIFEVLAQENLHTALRPAFEHLFKVLINKYPHYIKYLKHYNEIYLGLDLIIQNHFLKYYGSSFAENFYGLKRVPFESEAENFLKPNHKLPNKVHRKSLFFLVIFPYIKLLITKKYELERELEADGIKCKNSNLQKLRKFFLVIYPWIHFILETTILFYQLAFAFGKIRVHSPFIYLSGSRLTTLSQDDVAIATESFVLPSLESLSLKKMMSAIFKVTTHNVAVGITWSLSIGAFFIQFLEWWNVSKQTSLISSSQYIPPAPKLNQLMIKIDPHLCPLCLNKRTNDTALSTSGYVFCYRCIHQHLQQHGACPITKYVSNIDHLIRLYSPDS